MKRDQTHNYWQDQLPFYVAGNLPPAQGQALEQHLATCASCRQAVEDWRRIAAGVRAEASSWSVKLPPLAPDVRAAVAREQRAGRTGVYSDDATMPMPRVVARPVTPMRRSWNAVAMAAAVLTLVLFSGVIAFLANQNQEGDRSATQVALGAVDTTEEATDTVEASTSTETAAQTGTPRPAPTVTATRNADLGIQLPVTRTAEPTGEPDASNTPGAPGPSATALVASPNAPTSVATNPAFDSTGTCTITVGSADSVTLYRWPDTTSAVSGILHPGQSYAGFNQSGTGWYQVLAPQGGIAGWVPATAVMASSVCGSLPYPTATVVYEEFCMARSATGATLTTWFGPDEAMGTAGSVGGDETIAVIGRTDSGWYQVNVMYSVPALVWVRAADITLIGPCDGLTIVPWDGNPQTTATWTPTPPPQVYYFSADQDAIINGGTATLRWSTTAAQVWIEYYDANDSPGPNEPYIPDGLYPQLPPTGSLQVSIPAGYPHTTVRFALIMDSYSYDSRVTRAIVDLPVIQSQAQAEMEMTLRAETSPT